VSKPLDKPIDWIWSSFKDLCHGEIFSKNAWRTPGQHLCKVQRGEDPDDCKLFDDMGMDTKNIRIKHTEAAFRVMYVAKFEDAIYFCHCFKEAKS
jgi:phage-related protein